jgi:hypothetical protein
VEDVVAVAVRLHTGESRFFMTWGRIQDKVDPQRLEALVLRHARTCDLGGIPTEASVCLSLREASEAPYFYEGLLNFARAARPDAAAYAAWQDAIAADMQRGRHLYYLGRART